MHVLEPHVRTVCVRPYGMYSSNGTNVTERHLELLLLDKSDVMALLGLNV